MQGNTAVMFAFATGHSQDASGFATADSSPRSVSTSPPAHARYRVLLVDDDEKTLGLLRDILANYPDISIVGEAGNGLEAVAMATTHNPDVILMDITMPFLDGIEATHRIKTASPRTVVISFAGQFVTRTYNAMRTAGASAFLCKSDAFAIHDTIRSVLGQR